MGKNLLHSKILVQVFLLLTTLSAKAQIRIEAKFQPASITLSKTSVYKIIIHGTQDNPKGNIPSIDGLNLSSSPQTFRSASFINGVPSVRLEMSFQARPDFQEPLTCRLGISKLEGPVTEFPKPLYAFCSKPSRHPRERKI